MHKFRQLEGNLYLGPQPTEEDLKQAKKRGVQTVIDFRLPNEAPVDTEGLARANGLDYVNIPVDRNALAPAQVDEFDHAMSAHAGPFLIHCASGARAAMMLSLRKARHEGWSAERTFDESRAMGFPLETSAEFSAFVRSAVRPRQ